MDVVAPVAAVPPLLAVALVVFLGSVAQWFAWRVRLPAILPLLIIGFLVGPVFDLIDPSGLVSAGVLFPMVGLAVGLILFEGGLTLHYSDLTPDVRRTVSMLVSVGALVTWAGCALAGYYIAGLELPIAILFGALVIVTGPTVIGPLLRNVRPTGQVSKILKWEGILIDPVGAIAALLVLEYLLISTAHSGPAFSQTLLLFIEVLIVGSAMGVLGGFLLTRILRFRLLPDYLINIAALAMVFIFFAVSNTLASESGLLTTTLMGIYLANKRVPKLEELATFKEDLTIISISVLFIVLAANIELDALMAVLSWRSLALVAVIMLVIRPVNVFISAIGSGLSLQEKLFISWIGPRGIVAAAVSSLFALELDHAEVAGADILVPLVFLVIVGTVVVNSLSAKWVATRLGVAEPDPRGFLLMGGHDAARSIATFLQGEGLTVLVADTNYANIAQARQEGLPTFYGNLLSEFSDDEINLRGIGRLLALTSNDEANALAAGKYTREFDSSDVFQLEPSGGSERKVVGGEQRGRLLFHHGTTYAELEDMLSRGGKLKKTKITEKFRLDDFQKFYSEDYIPMFIMSASGKEVRVITEETGEPDVGMTLVAMVIEPIDEAIKLHERAISARSEVEKAAQADGEAEAEAEKSDDKKADDKKSEVKKADDEKAGDKKIDHKKAEVKKADDKKSEAKPKVTSKAKKTEAAQDESKDTKAENAKGLPASKKAPRAKAKATPKKAKDEAEDAAES